MTESQDATPAKLNGAQYRELYCIEPTASDEKLAEAKRKAFRDFQEMGLISADAEYSEDEIDQRMIYSAPGIINESYLEIETDRKRALAALKPAIELNAAQFRSLYGIEPTASDEELAEAKRKAFRDFQENNMIPYGMEYSEDVIDSLMISHVVDEKGNLILDL